MVEHQVTKKTESLYQKIFGSDKNSVSGPLFFLIIGCICTLACLLLLFFGISFNASVLENDVDGSIRPDPAFPLLSILILFSIAGACVGLIMGLIGIIWYFITKSKDKI